ncbi:V-type ATP synthase subunit D [Bullifex porci]|uniref:V-type ATP synthase subunit D n=1 Tax=Bullifex porci TaxID=2606638 RepID=UPI0023F33F31|nr:V-type ATP synthase subunit D [Bullifex porci]MDD7254912.1 V-type ATP synthase subunit D [Bullifex porci]MDY2741597.1 V-type ATP synthase subunit D [Bullifex porci]
MAVKLTKNEQKKQKDALKQFNRYLPTLQLKKQQLQTVIRQIEGEIEEYKLAQQKLISSLQNWIAVFGENSSFDSLHTLDNLVKIDTIKKGKGNIAGVEIPVFEDLTFKDISYSLFEYPLWVDSGIEALKKASVYDARVKTLQEQIDLLNKELRTTSQRVNLFEKVKIPEAKENIRRIGIYLGDQQTSAVVRGKIAKKKLTKEDIA